MANYRTMARRSAARYGLDPDIFERQIEAESGFNPRAKSRAGAGGIAQIMPGTARAWGVDPYKPKQALDAAAKNMARMVKKYGSYEAALRGYNAGEGAIEASKQYRETNDYVQKILRGRDPGKIAARPARARSPLTGAQPAQPAKPLGPPVTPDGLDKSGLLQQYLATRGQPGALIDLAGGLGSLKTPMSEAVPAVPGVRAPRVSTGGGAAPGAVRAVQWATKKIGNRETGTNSGGLASYANSRFGMRNQPWCAMFTSLAVTKGGAPPSARTASVAEVLRKAQKGEGYKRGFVPPQAAKPGDLVAFGTRHIGMIVGNENGKLTMIAGNDSNRVNRRAVPVGSDTRIVRPDYK